jgi:uncharacterized low-complexity protein
MNIVKKSSIAMVMSLLALGLFTSNIAKAEANPFATGELVTIVTDHKEGKCGEGKCGEGKMKDAKKGKCGEGKCGEGKSKDKGKKCGG